MNTTVKTGKRHYSTLLWLIQKHIITYKMFAGHIVSSVCLGWSQLSKLYFMQYMRPSGFSLPFSLVRIVIMKSEVWAICHCLTHWGRVTHICVIIITHAPMHFNDFRGVHARYVKRTGLRSSDRNAQVKGQQPLWHSFVYVNVWHHNGVSIATIVATIATTS